MIRAAIFDLDGTLIDSLGVWKKIDHDFLAARGIKVPSTYFDEISALGLLEVALYTIERFGLSDTPEQLIDEWHGMAAHEYAHNIRLKPYAREYLQNVKNAGILLATATSLHERLSDAVLRNNGIFHMFDEFCYTCEVARGKSFPDVYLLAAQKLGVSPAECIVFEDIPQGVLSAKAAGMTVVGVLDDAFSSGWDTIKASADYCVEDFSNAPKFRSSGLL